MAWHMQPWRASRRYLRARLRSPGAWAAPLERVERLSRILYNHYDRKGDSSNAVIFNNLGTSWREIIREAQEPVRGRLF